MSSAARPLVNTRRWRGIAFVVSGLCLAVIYSHGNSMIPATTGAGSAAPPLSGVGDYSVAAIPQDAIAASRGYDGPAATRRDATFEQRTVSRVPVEQVGQPGHRRSDLLPHVLARLADLDESSRAVLCWGVATLARPPPATT